VRGVKLLQTVDRCEQLPSNSGMDSARRLLTRSRKVMLLMPVAARGSPAGSNQTGRWRGTTANES
jgi:hypothetical protein